MMASTNSNNDSSGKTEMMTIMAVDTSANNDEYNSDDN